MTDPKMILVGGGARSGKSRFALALAKNMGERRIFIATAETLDEEMSERAATHKKERGADFVTLEEAYEVPSALAKIQGADVVVLDCLTLWLANLLLAGKTQADILQRIDEMMQIMQNRTFGLVVVTNEVGMGIVPENHLGRDFRDVCGRAHQRLSLHADVIYCALLGVMIRLKPAPISFVGG